MKHIQHAWKEYASDFNAMTDEEIERETNLSQELVDQHEAWIEAALSWHQAGKPRKNNEDMTTKEWLSSLEMTP